MEARHELLGGKVQLFKRPKSPFWQCSASISGNQYKVSSKLESLAQAKDFAEDWFLTLKGKERFGGGLAKGKKFRIASALFVSEYKALMATERSPRYIKLLENIIKNHLDPFFGDLAVQEITEDTAQSYRVHRSQNKDKDGAPRPPARTTIHHEIIALGHVMKTAKRKGWITHVPSFSAPYKKSGKIAHRAWFSPEEYRQLRTATQERAKHPPNPKWRWECEQFHDYVLFQANCGLRPDEASNLEFRDVTIELDGVAIRIDTLEQYRALIERCNAEGWPEPVLKLDVRGKRGTGKCVSMPGAVRPFIRLKTRLRAVPEIPSELTRDRRKKTAGRRLHGTEPYRPRGSRGGMSRGAGSKMAPPNLTERLFPTPVAGMMNTVLGGLNLKKDRDGQVRSPYSLRHTYICFRIMEGASIYQIAKNCRTSVEMIEKYYASHIQHQRDVEAINVRKQKSKVKDLLKDLQIAEIKT